MLKIPRFYCLKRKIIEPKRKSLGIISYLNIQHLKCITKNMTIYLSKNEHTYLGNFIFGYKNDSILFLKEIEFGFFV